MRDLFLGLYAEGITDDRFLPPLIQRVTEQLLTRSKGEMVEVRDILILNGLINKQVSGSEEQILEAARVASNCNILFVHSDADDQPLATRRQYNFEPGYQKVLNAKAKNENVCDNLIPIIPMRMIESWLLADMESLLFVVEAKKQLKDIKLPQSLGRIPAKVHEIESYAHPKEAARYIVENAHPNFRKWRMSIVYERMARQIRLDILRELESFRAFENELFDALVSSGILKP